MLRTKSVASVLSDVKTISDHNLYAMIVGI